ncbi:hypothetical protein [Streptomyces nodosus]|uniref:Uncharacterized protein n=1 Tax=Streptomyces nodosus TaxID=40318 RepID=A0A0B5D621_9ACTN|nr:hypothetical protein [Streptomyces nodosus]AJE38683.1 hypothetical protein SNOD_00070 [Streptomyces nodosus]MBB4796180.1 hypothetical protein [Streptomyces nodosus]QEV37258.1 hypothetical protein CP978_00410 [Streptomyces nodosus]
MVPSGLRTARDLAALSGRLFAAQRLQLPLRTRLALLETVARQAERCAAAAVYETRQAGASWEEIAAAAGTTATQASALWDTPALRVLFPPRQPQTDRQAAAQRLADALAYLQCSSGVSVDQAAEQAGLEVPYLLQVLDGGSVPAWPEVYTLVTVFGGAAEELRVLWESARGAVHPPVLPPQGAAGYLAAALRGQYLAAGSPALSQLSGRALLPSACIGQVLAGHHAPPWPATARLVRALGGRSEDIEPLWQAVLQAATALDGPQLPQQLGCADCRITAPHAP